MYKLNSFRYRGEEYNKRAKFKCIDLAADNDHPGPKSNKLYAEELFKFYKENLLKN